MFGRFDYGLPDPQEERVLAFCITCGGEVYESNLHCETEYGLIHRDCRHRYAEEHGEETPVVV